MCLQLLASVFVASARVQLRTVNQERQAASCFIEKPSLFMETPLSVVGR